MASETTQDKWAQWLLRRRHGENSDIQKSQLAFLAPIRNRVLQNAGITAGDTVLDVGAGDGLIAFGALDRTGETGRSSSAIFPGTCWTTAGR